MRPVTPTPDPRPGSAARPTPAKPTGPGLSKATFRWQREWGKRARKFAVLYLPLLIVALLVWRLSADESWQQAVQEQVNKVVDVAMHDPELAVRWVDVSGASEAMSLVLIEKTASLVGISSMSLRVASVRQEIESIGAIRSARVALSPKGVLKVSVRERRPVALWRDAGKELQVIDREGIRIAAANGRADHPDLVLLLGEGAPDHVREALSVMRSAPDLQPRLRALVRVGERRWDMVLDRDLRVLLPADNAAEAAARVMALHLGQDQLLDRDLKVIDMRIPDRPVLRMHDRALEAWRRQKLVDTEEGEDT